jgi:protoheme IX farnesyltransferase
LRVAAAIETSQVLPARTFFQDILTLLKLRISVFVGFAAFCGYYMGSYRPVDLVRMFHTVLATIMVSAGACTLNQYIERDLDALMERTRNRPLPSGRLSPAFVFTFGIALSIFGLVYLALAVNAISSAFGAITLASYVFLYTPLKTRTSICTIVGALPGALPPVIGWAAARGEVNFGAWLIFGIMFIWQLPHFLAIGWIYREDYLRAGMPMLPVIDKGGDLISRQMVMHSIALLVLSIFPGIAGLAGPVYLFAAIVMGILYIALAIRWSLRPRWDRARQVFWASLAHLGLLLAIMVLNKT